MLDSSAETRPDPSSGVSPTRHRMPTRFGTVEIDEARVVRLPHGLFGFPGRTLFIVTDLPERRSPFKLLQSAEDPNLGLLVLPVDPAAEMIRRGDLEQAASQAGIALDELAGLVVVTLRNAAGEVRCTANLKAPILINSRTRIGFQHVLTGHDYDVRHPLAFEPEAA